MFLEPHSGKWEGETVSNINSSETVTHLQPSIILPSPHLCSLCPEGESEISKDWNRKGIWISLHFWKPPALQWISLDLWHQFHWHKSKEKGGREAVKKGQDSTYPTAAKSSPTPYSSPSHTVFSLLHHVSTFPTLSHFPWCFSKCSAGLSRSFWPGRTPVTLQKSFPIPAAAFPFSPPLKGNGGRLHGLGYHNPPLCVSQTHKWLTSRKNSI